MREKIAGYSWRRFLGDCAGGIIATLIALPYGLSMAALMGLPPILGVVTSVFTAPITAFLGRNPVLIGGTASVTVPFISEAVRLHGIAGAAKVSIVASIIMMVFCVLRLGRYVGRIPHTVVAGFSAGIGAIMVISQLNVILGVPSGGGGNAISQLAAVLWRVPSARLEPMVLGCAVMITAFLLAWRVPRLPAPLIGVAVSGLIAFLLRYHEPEVGTLALTLPPFVGFSWAATDIYTVLPSGFGLAFVTGVNLLLTSRVVEHFRGRARPLRRTDADAELGAYGIANLFVGLFGAPMSVGIPARSLANVRCGGTTRISNLMHGIFLFALVRLGSGALAHIPLAALAGVTAWMGLSLLDWGAWRRLGKMRTVDAAAFLSTAVGVLVVNAVAAVLIGCSFYMILHAYRSYQRWAALPVTTAEAGVRE